MCLEKLNKSHQAICWLIFSALFISISIFILKIYPDFRFILLKPSCQEFSLDITAIVLGAISTFIAILIPLHYSIVLDIVQKISDSNNNNPNEIKNLKLYVASSDIIIAVTAIFGISSLLAGAVAMGVHMQIIPERNNWLKTISIIYLVMLCTSIARSFCLTIKREFRVISNNKFNYLFLVYIIYILIGGFLSINWARLLYHFKKPHNNALEALITLAIFYSLWLFLKLPFIPITRVMRLFKNGGTD